MKACHGLQYVKIYEDIVHRQKKARSRIHTRLQPRRVMRFGTFIHVGQQCKLPFTLSRLHETQKSVPIIGERTH